MRAAWKDVGAHDRQAGCSPSSCRSCRKQPNSPARQTHIYISLWSMGWSGLFDSSDSSSSTTHQTLQASQQTNPPNQMPSIPSLALHLARQDDLGLGNANDSSAMTLSVCRFPWTPRTIHLLRWRGLQQSGTTTRQAGRKARSYCASLVEVNTLGNCSTALGWLCALRLYLSSSCCSGTRNGSLFSLAGFLECECQSHSFNIFVCPSAFVMRMSRPSWSMCASWQHARLEG
ncbi:uncharacterized protein IWZ02DRAFT_174130 [Phyllosticta citriasiana]|uniref:uncharacterized protein n=1 Tax=Phyllosticta citriasiana TaxID=595635 RepID=UPI0030FD4CFC